MKLYVVNKQGEKEYLSYDAPTRLSLARKIGSRSFYLNNKLYNVRNVRAEPGNAAVTGSVAGGLIGALGGPIGILLGLGIGTIIGGTAHQEDVGKVNKFNRSRI